MAALPLWQWHEIPNTKLSSVDPAGIAGSAVLLANGPKSKIDAWCGAALKRSGSVYILGACGGHNDYAGNEVNALALNVEAPQWVQLRGPTPAADLYKDTSIYKDGRPAATHTYSMSHFIGARNRFIVFARDGLGTMRDDIAAPPPNWPYTGEAWSKSFNLSTNDWDPPEYIPQFPAMPSGDAPGALCCKHPVTEDVYVSRNYAGGFWRWNAASNTWTRLAGGNRGPWYVGAAIDPKRNRMLYCGSYSGTVGPGVLDLDGVGIAVSFRGLGAETLLVGGYPGVLYDENLDKYVVVHNREGFIEVATVDAGTWLVERPPMTGAPPRARLNGIHNAAQYVPELRGFVIANQHGGNVYFVRTSA